MGTGLSLDPVQRTVGEIKVGIEGPIYYERCLDTLLNRQEEKQTNRLEFTSVRDERVKILVKACL